MLVISRKNTSMKLRLASAASLALLLVLSGCATAENETLLPETPVVTDDSSSPSDESDSANTLDKTEGIENDASVIASIVNVSNATCDKAKSEGVVETSDDGVIISVIIPEALRLEGYYGFHLIEDEFYPEYDLAAFSSCAMSILASVSKEAYGEPLAHISVEDKGDGKYLFSYPWLELADFQRYVSEDGVLTSIEVLDEESEELLISRNLSFGVSDEYVAQYSEYANPSGENDSSESNQ